MNLVLESLKRFPDLAVEDDQPTQQKISALKTMLRHFEKEENYEDCAFIRDLQKRIEDEEKRGISRDEQ
jgi:protein-arginine kinase activator protein McsA